MLPAIASNGWRLLFSQCRADASDLTGHFQSVQGDVVDPSGRLWILDIGSFLFAAFFFRGPKLVTVDLRTNRIIRKVRLPSDVFRVRVRVRRLLGSRGFRGR
ncbi:L-dopachrome tautomerase-related protein [Streptomyces sp. NPDC087859]|uniref:L-dopachrome tautomerase-related protein n=1 Tax=Streptomyces sp. NPDC087859 TaxID=3365812 RepID=UPI0038162529